MKKIFYFIVVMFVTIIYSFCFASDTIDDSLENMELAKYYGILPLHLSIHTEIGMGESTDEIISSFVTLLKDMKFYADVDILKYLKRTVYPQNSLDKILNNITNLLSTSNVLMSYIDNQKTIFVQHKDSCDNKKSITDKNFSLALRDFDGVNMERYLLSSIDSETCAVESRIMYNAYDKMKFQIKYYYDILAKKYDYFYSNKYEIIQSFK